MIWNRCSAGDIHTPLRDAIRRAVEKNDPPVFSSPSANRCIWGGLSAFGLALAGCAHSPDHIGDRWDPEMDTLPDPVVENWPKPDKWPEFRERLTGEDFESRLASVWDEFGEPGEIAERAHVATGHRLAYVSDDSQAIQLGLEVGDVFTAVNGQRLWLGNSIPDQDEPFTVTYVTRDGEQKEAQVEPGPIGIRRVVHWQPEVIYLDRGGELDPLVLAGILMREHDPDLAETAWRRAIMQGYRPDALSAYCGAMITLQQNRPGVALQFGYAALDRDADDDPLIHPHALYRIAMANARFDLMATLAEEYPLAFEEVRSIALHHLSRLAEENPMGAQTPSERALEMKREDVVDTYMALNDRAEAHRPGHQLPFTMDPPAGHHRTYHFAPPEPTFDAEMIVRFRIDLHHNDVTRWANQFTVSLTSPDRVGRFLRSGWEQLTVKIRALPELMVVGHGQLPATLYFSQQHLALDGETQHEVRLVRVGHWVELLVNGNRVALSPVYEGDNHVGFYLQAVGIRAVIEELIVARLHPEPDTTARH